MKQTSLFTLAILLVLAFALPSVSHASFLLGVSPETQTATTLAANSTWLDLTVENSDGPVSVYDGMQALLGWSAPDFLNISNCSITYPGQSGAVTEPVAFSGSETVALYPSKSPLGYVELTCTHSGELGHDVVLINKIERPTTPPPATHTGAGVGPGSAGGGSGVQVIQVGVPVTSGNTFQYSGTGGSGSGGTINFGGIYNGITNTVANGVGTIRNTVSGITNGIASGILGNRAANALGHGVNVANNAVTNYFTQPTTNWINNHIIDPLRNFLGLGNNQGSGSNGTGNSGTQGQGGAGADSTNRNTGSGNAGGSSGSSGGGYQVHVGPLSSGASGPTDGSNDCNGGTDNCNNNNNPYGFEQDPSKVQNTNDNH